MSEKNFKMTIGELKKRLETLDDNALVLAEDKISGHEFDFKILMNMYENNGNLVFYLR